MAITIHDTPKCADTHKYVPLNNELYFVVLSDKITEPNFRYIHQIYTDAGLAATIRQFPNPDGYGYLDVHRIVRSYVGNSWVDFGVNGQFGTIDLPGGYGEFYVVFGEEYGDTVVTSTATTTSEMYYTIPATIPHLDYIAFDSTDYVGGDDTRSPLTNMKDVRIRSGAGAWLDILQDDVHLPQVRINTYAESFGMVTQFGSYVIDGFPDVFSVFNRVLRCPTGPRNIDLINSAFITTEMGFLPIIKGDGSAHKTVYYTVWWEQPGSGSITYSYDFSSIADSGGDLLSSVASGDVQISNGSLDGYYIGSPTTFTTLCEIINMFNNALTDEMQNSLGCGSSSTVSSGTDNYGTITVTFAGPGGSSQTFTFPAIQSGTAPVQLSETVTYHVMDDQCRYHPHHLIFRNRLGGWDSIQITQGTVRTTNVKRDSYQRVMGGLSGNQWQYNANERGTTVFQSLSTKKIKGSTFILTDDEWTWVEEFIESTEIFEEMEVNGVVQLVPVVLLTNDYEEKYGAKDGPAALTVEYAYSHKNNPRT